MNGCDWSGSLLARAFEDSGHKAEGEQMQTAFFIFLKINIRKVTGRNLDFNGGLLTQQQ